MCRIHKGVFLLTLSFLWVNTSLAQRAITTNGLSKNATIQAVEPLTIQLTNEPSICLKDTARVWGEVAVGGIKPYSFVWKGVDVPYYSTEQYPSFSPERTSMYTLLVTDSIGNRAEKTFRIVVFPLPDKPIILRDNDTLRARSKGALAYEWYKNNERITDAQADSYSITNAAPTDSFRAIAISADGCRNASDNVQIQSISNVYDDKDMEHSSTRWRIYPTPCSTQLHIQGAMPGIIADIHINSILGIKVFHAQMFNEVTTLQLEHLAPGVYGITITEIGGETYNYTMIKE